MSRSYIPEKTCSICSFQMNPEPRKLIKSNGVKSVCLNSTEILILTKEDRALEEPFKCRKPGSGGLQKLLGGIGLGAGTAVAGAAATSAVAAGSTAIGAALLSNPIGWCVLGVIAVGLIVWGIIELFNTKPCDTMLELSEWQDYYTEATFDGCYVILQASFIPCKNKGMLVPIMDPSIANKAAANISSYNNWEAGISGSAALIGGILFPIAIVDVTTLSSGAWFLGKIGIGTTAIGYGTHKQTQMMIESSGNDFAEENLADSFSIEDTWKTVNDPSDLTSITDYESFINTYPAVSGAMKSAGELAYGRNSQIYGLLNSLAGKTSNQLKTDPNALKLFQLLKDGKLPEIRNLFKHSGTNRIPKVNSSNVKNALESVSKPYNQTSQNFRSQLGASAKAAGGIYVVLAPFFANFFGTSASIELAKAVQEDMN